MSSAKGARSLRAEGTGSFNRPDVVLGAELRLSVRAVHPLNHCAVSPTPTSASVPSPDLVLQRRQS